VRVAHQGCSSLHYRNYRAIDRSLDAPQCELSNAYVTRSVMSSYCYLHLISRRYLNCKHDPIDSAGQLYSSCTPFLHLAFVSCISCQIYLIFVTYKLLRQLVLAQPSSIISANFSFYMKHCHHRLATRSMERHRPCLPQ